ncbi:MAG TPA: type II secretion system F family protein, partial [Actinomycetota bacterium]|nr:type II secretion system F family protein [Actinomycetota bacterium]
MSRARLGKTAARGANGVTRAPASIPAGRGATWGGAAGPGPSRPLPAPAAHRARRAAARGRRMAAELPDLLDLLRVAVEAGLPVGRALGEVGRRHGGPLSREWAATAIELQLGVPRDEALDRLVRRCPPPAVATLAAALRRAERHGAPLAGT